MKLKQLLKETKVWERKFGESLPVLELKFGSKAQYDKYKKNHNIKDGTKIEVDGKKMTHKSSLPKGSKSANKKADVFAADANAKMDRDEKEMELKAMKQALKDMENESVEINEKVSDYNREYLNKKTGFDVWNDKKLPIIVKNMKLTMNDLEKTVKIKDGKSFDDVLQRIQVSVNILKKYLNLR